MSALDACIHLLRHKGRGQSGTSGISFDLAITVQISEVSSENIFNTIFGRKIGLVITSSEGSRESAECVLKQPIRIIELRERKSNYLTCDT